MAHFKRIVKNKKEGKIIYGDGIVESIVRIAISELSYVELADKRNKFRGNPVKIVFDKNSVDVDVVVSLNYTQSVPDIAFKIQETVRHSVESTADYKVNSVNVSFVGIDFEETTPVDIKDHVEEVAERAEKPETVSEKKTVKKEVKETKEAKEIKPPKQVELNLEEAK